MGTNYYFTKVSKPCPTCKHDPDAEVFHIGKSSAGWCFSLRIHPERDIRTLDDWKKLWTSEGVIENEYSEVLTVEQMLDVITKRGEEGATFADRPPPSNGYASWAAFHSSNHSEPGPNGMLRHQLGGQYSSRCVRHGEGTYDYIEGEFS